jgi:hypothetical protein
LYSDFCVFKITDSQNLSRCPLWIRAPRKCSARIHCGHHLIGKISRGRVRTSRGTACIKAQNAQDQQQSCTTLPCIPSLWIIQIKEYIGRFKAVYSTLCSYLFTSKTTLNWFHTNIHLKCYAEIGRSCIAQSYIHVM